MPPILLPMVVNIVAHSPHLKPEGCTPPLMALILGEHLQLTGDFATSPRCLMRPRKLHPAQAHAQQSAWELPIIGSACNA